jgi:hypothetical protein
MRRNVPFEKNLRCDGCGVLGAFDFMGDFYCVACMQDDDSPVCECGEYLHLTTAGDYYCDACTIAAE